MNTTEQYLLNRPTTRFGRWMFRYLPYRKSVVMGNIDQVYGETISLEAKKHLAIAFYSHFIQIIFETLKLRFLSDDQLKSLVSVEGVEYLLDVAQKGQGVLVLTGHFGNWEFAPLGGMSQFKQYQGHLHFIRRTLGSKTLERLLFKRYYQAGLRIIPKKFALNKIIKVLEDNHAVVFVLDQHASPVNKDGIVVDFFGKPAGTYRSLAMIAHYTEVPVVPAACYRTESGQHVLKFYPPLPWMNAENAETEILKNTQAYNQVLEKIILERPEQWWWLHKRWKLKE